MHLDTFSVCEIGSHLVVQATYMYKRAAYFSVLAAIHGDQVCHSFYKLRATGCNVLIRVPAQAFDARAIC